MAVQTVFEGFSTNTEAKAWSTAEGFDLDIPVGHDPGPTGGRSSILGSYRTGGTPWSILIDRRGVVRYNDFRIRAKEAIALIERLLVEVDADAPPTRSVEDAVD